MPVGYWNKALCGKLGVNSLSHKQEWALDVIRRWSVEKIWRRSITKCFCLWLKSKAASRKSIQLLFQPKIDFDKNFDRDFITLKRFERVYINSRLLNLEIQMAVGLMNGLETV